MDSETDSQVDNSIQESETGSAAVESEIVNDDAVTDEQQDSQVDNSIQESETGSAAVERDIVNDDTVADQQQDCESDVSIVGSEIASAVFGTQVVKEKTIIQPKYGDDYSHATVHQHNYYGIQDRVSAPSGFESGTEETGITMEIPEGYCQLSDDIYMCSKPLRKGTRVYRGFQRHASGRQRPLAIKAIFGCQPENLKEVEYLLALTPHPNVVQIIHSKERTSFAGCELYIVMELCGDQNLQDYLNEIKEKNIPLDFERTMSLSKQLLNGVKHIHKNEIIHRDLKPENILLLPGSEHLKITDFGISKELQEGRSVTKQTNPAGTDGFRAPETFSKEKKISKKTDIFSLGILLFLVWSNGLHVFGPNIHLRNNNIITNQGLDFSGLLISRRKRDQLLDLVKKMLHPDPSQRPTIVEVIQDAFFSEKLEDYDATEKHQQEEDKAGAGAAKLDGRESGEIDSLSSDKLRETDETPATNIELEESTLQVLKDPAQRLDEMKELLQERGVTVLSLTHDTESYQEWEGTFGSKTVTIKKYVDKQFEESQCFRNAVSAFKILKHGNIAHFYNEIPVFCIVLSEHFAQGNLQDFLKDITGKKMVLRELIRIMVQVASGMTYLHSMDYIHCGLMATSVSVGEDMVCKISDFSFARHMDGKEFLQLTLDDKLPPVKWIAPEFFYDLLMSQKCDVWSFGVLLWQSFSGGKTPFPNFRDEDYLTAICGERLLAKPRECPQQLYNIMVKCWNSSPHKRPTFEWLEEILLAEANEISTKAKGSGSSSVKTLEEIRPGLQQNGVDVFSHLRDSELINEDWLCREWKGEFASETVTIKRYEGDSNMMFSNEVNALKVLKHENIVCLLKEIPELRVIVTEHCAVGILPEVLQSKAREDLPNFQLLAMAMQVASGMTYIHEKGFVHSSLMGRSISVGSNMVCKISDFSCARFGAYQMLLPVKSLKKWLAPESAEMLSQKTDVWSFGVVVWEIFSRGEEPYSEYNQDEALGRVSGGYRMKKPLECPDEIFSKIMMACWEKDPNARPEFVQLEKKLKKLLDDLKKTEGDSGIGISSSAKDLDNADKPATPSPNKPTGLLSKFRQKFKRT